MFGSIVSACCRFKQWAKSIGILDIANLWGYWRSDTGVNGKLAVNLNGTDEYLSVNNSNFIGSDQDFSVFIVFNTGTTPAVGALATVWDETGNQRSWLVRVNNTTIRFQIDSLGTGFGGLTQFTTTGTLSDDTYYLMACTYNATTDVMRVNVYNTSGSEVLDETTSHSGGAYTGTDQFTIGAIVTGGTPSGYHDGKIDQVSYFTKELSTTEIEELVNSGTGIKHGDLTGSETFYSSIAAWYDFDSPRNFGRESSQETHAVQLGSSDYFDCGTFFNSIIQGGSWTLNFWLKFTSGGSTGTEVIFGGIDTSVDELFQFVHVDDGSGNDGKLWFKIGDGTNTVSCFSDETFQDDGVWRFLSISCSSDTVKMYINGVLLSLDTSDISSVNQSIIDISNGLHLGQRSGSFGAVPFVGVIDQSSVYNAELSASTINSLYNNGVPLNYSDLSAAQKTNLVSHWDFNEQDHTIIGQDSHTNLNHLTATSIAEADLVGGKDSLDLTENGIDSSNAVGGVVTGNIANQEAVNEWLDLSGNSNDMTQATIAQQPIAVENGIGTDPSFNCFWNDGSQRLTRTARDWSNMDLTVAIWVKKHSFSTGTYQFAIGQWGSSGNRVWGIRYGNTGLQISATTNGIDVTSTLQYTSSGDTWYLVVGQFDNSTFKLKHWIYDTTGTLLEESAESASIGGTLSTATGEPFLIGGAGTWEGEVANATVYDKLLTTSEHNAVVSAMVEEVGL